jgi:hypothetical protein
MSLENVIAEHAAALNNLAEAIRAALGVGRPILHADANALTVAHVTGKGSTGVAPDAELDKAVGKVEDDAQAKAMAAVEEKKAKAKADAKAKKDAADKAAADAAASAASSQTAGADSSDDGLGEDDGLGDDEPVPDYKTVVRPALLEAIKRTDKATVLELVKSYGVAKAEDLDPSVYREIMGKAAALGV